MQIERIFFKEKTLDKGISMISMPYFSFKNIFLIVGFFIVFLFGYYYFFIVMPNGELGQKERWAILQSTELQHRGDPDVKTPLFLERVFGSEYNVLGIPTNDNRFPRAWIIVNKKFGEGKVNVLQEKNQALFITCSYVSALDSQTRIEPTVLAFLSSICASDTDPHKMG